MSQKLKVAFCIPCYGDPKGKFLQSLLDMQAYFLSSRLEAPDGTPYEKEVKTFIVSTSMLTEGRHRLIAEALNWEADFMLCMDADHTFPEDALDRLLVHNKMVVGCNYARRGIPTAPTAARIDKTDDSHTGLLYTTAEKAEAGVVEECAHLGMGFVLINMKLFDHLQAYVESLGERSFLPLFKFEPAPDFKGMRGEDVYFFEKVRASGVSVWCDHGLSWSLGHCHDIIMTHQHTIDQRDAWAKQETETKQRFLEKADEMDSRARVEGAVYGT